MTRACGALAWAATMTALAPAGWSSTAVAQEAPRATPAEVSADVRLLPWRRAVEPRDATAWVEVWDDSLLAAGTVREFDDVRFIDRAGVSQPFWRRAPSLHDQWVVSLDGVTRTETAGQITLTADLRGRQPLEVAVRIRDRTHGLRLAVQTSDDSVVWRDVAFPGVGPQPEGGVEIVDVGLVSKRWVRIVAPGDGFHPPGAMIAARPDAPDLTLRDAVELLERRQRRTPRVPVRFRITREQFEARTWIAEVEIEGPPMALCRVVLSPRTALARHPVRVEGRLGEGGWRDLAHATIEIVPLADGTRRIDAIEWDPLRTTALRLRVEGADAPNAPVAIDSLARTPVRFAFPSPPDPRWIAYGDGQVLPAHSMLADETMARTEFARAALGPVERNPVYRAPGFGLAWLQRHPRALTFALIAVLGLVAAVVLQRPRQDRRA